MKLLKAMLVLFTISIVFIGCNPDDDNITINPNPVDFSKNFGASASRDFIGQVVNADDQPIQGATVKIGSITAQTDANGVFIISGASVYENFAYITATKTGYNDGSRALIPTTGKNKVKIMLTEFAPTMTIASGTASEVSIYSGTKIKFDGAFQTESGMPYSGNVSVCMFHLTPSNPDVDDLMPGMLYAQDALGQERLLETYGMLQVELRGSDGQKLQLATGHTAQITMRIDDTQLAVAPATIPLWHFDEVNGYWKQEGSATKIGNNYVGNVSHFSWWNCDIPLVSINLSARVVDAFGNPLSDILVALQRSGNGDTRCGVTDNNGAVSGIVPANESLTIKITNPCGTLYTGTIGPFATDTTLPDIVINNTLVTPTLVQGSVLDCNNTNVTNGYVVLRGTPESGSPSIIPISNGVFSINRIYCNGDTQFSLEAFDFDNSQSSNIQNYNFTPTLTNVGSIITCTAVTELIWHQIDNRPAKYFTHGFYGETTSADGLPGGLHLTAASADGDVLSIWSYNANIVPGNYTSADFYVDSDELYIDVSTVNTIIFHVNSIGPVGGYIDLSFSGTYTEDNNNVVHTVNGQAHIKRMQ
jgi:hypothetical protein